MKAGVVVCTYAVVYYDLGGIPSQFGTQQDTNNLGTVGNN